MASQAAQAAGKTTRGMFSRWGRRDPELYVHSPIPFHSEDGDLTDITEQVLAGVVTTAFVGLGYYIGTKDKISEQNVVLPKDKAMPWQTEGAEDGDLFKYKVSLNPSH